MSRYGRPSSALRQRNTSGRSDYPSVNRVDSAVSDRRRQDISRGSAHAGYRREPDSDAVEEEEHFRLNSEEQISWRNNDSRRSAKHEMEKKLKRAEILDNTKRKSLLVDSDQSQLPKWKRIHSNDGSKTKNEDMTVTHINQVQGLFTQEGIDDACKKLEKSNKWIHEHSIETHQLTLKDLFKKGKILSPKQNASTGKLQQRIEFTEADLIEFEFKLNGLIQLYTNRIKWLVQGSRKMFGFIKGSSVALLVDSSNASLDYERLSELQQDLMHLIDEQLFTKSKLYPVAFGTETHPMWKEPQDVNQTFIEEMKDWVHTLSSRGGTNLLCALKHVYTLKDLRTIVIILGSVPDQDANILCDYIDQISLTRNIRIHGVLYNCNNKAAEEVLRRLADTSDGTFHCHSSMSQEYVYQSTDISVILTEIEKCKEIISKIQDMRNGYLGSAAVTIQDELTKKISQISITRTLPRPPGHDLPLNIHEPAGDTLSSADWLSQHGLKAKKLDLYQVLAPNAFSLREEFVPVIKRTVQAQIHGRAMTQFQWHDGTTKNIHVDVAQLYEYQKRLGAAVRLYEQRIDWVQGAGRRHISSVSEKNVVILLDLCAANAPYIVHIQQMMRSLLEQQISHISYFNIIGCSENVTAWKPTLVKPTGELLQEAWRWVLDLECNGTRNIMGGMRLALENDLEASHNIEVAGLYLFTSGVPDQSVDLCYSYLDEMSAGRSLKLHVTYFSIDTIPAANHKSTAALPAVEGGRYATSLKTVEALKSLAHFTGGRFHSITQSNLDSDDVKLLAAEIEKAINYSKKCALLVDSVKKKCSMESSGERGRTCSYHADVAAECADNDRDDDDNDDVDEVAVTVKPVLPPRETALSIARKERLIEKEKEVIPKTLAYKDGQVFRPSSAKVEASGSSAVPKSSRPTSAVESRKKGISNSSAWKKSSINSSSYGEKSEETMTTKSWMKMYSLNKQKLNLDKLNAGSECNHIGHKSNFVQVLGRSVEAKLCQIYPTVVINGEHRHVLLSAAELVNYEQQVSKLLTRYLKRLQWLLAGSRRVFGTVSETRCVFLIDTSGSMEESMDELKKELITLIWEQLHKHRIWFNLVRFSRTCSRWKSALVEPTEENCMQAADWVSELKADGNTCTLDALQMAFEDKGVESVYLLTDGKPDTSTALVLEEVTKINSDLKVKINTISFNCNDSIANNFLKILASKNRGRYHKVVANFDVHLFSHQLIEGGFIDPETPPTPQLEGDDLHRLIQEINKARRFISTVQTYRKAVV